MQVATDEHCEMSQTLDIKQKCKISESVTIASSQKALSIQNTIRKKKSWADVHVIHMCVLVGAGV